MYFAQTNKLAKTDGIQHTIAFGSMSPLSLQQLLTVAPRYQLGTKMMCVCNLQDCEQRKNFCRDSYSIYTEQSYLEFF